ncbi:MAG: SBBP repeat-containing protein, partial [Candidatus Thorarchaeota archaeon]
IWPNIDLYFRLTSDGLKYEYLVNPGGDVSDIQVRLIGHEALLVEREQIEIVMDGFTIIDRALVGYQDDEEISVDFIQKEIDIYGFQVGDYDNSSVLVIDPLLYSTFLGGFRIDVGRDIALDDEGNFYITGYTNSTNFPTLNAYDPTHNTAGSPDHYDCFISKFTPSGDLVYSTYIGGSYNDEGLAITVDGRGHAYVTGRTRSYDFPIVNGYDDSVGATYGGYFDCFVLELNATGTGLVFSTYIGGNGRDEGNAISIDNDGNIYIAGTTSGKLFPTFNAYDDTWNDGYDCFVLKMNSTGTGLLYSTYVGGTFSLIPPFEDRDDYAVAMAVDSDGNTYVTGYTNSLDFPTVNAYDDTLGSWNTDDCFIIKLNATGNELLYSTYIGGVGSDRATDITVDSSGTAYITGSTQSSDFPITDAYDPALNGTSDVFLVALSPAGDQVLYSTYLGGSETDQGLGLCCDTLNNIYLGGTTASPDFPTVNGAEYEGNGSADCFVLRMNLTANTLSYSTCIGGVLNDNLLSIVLGAYGTVYATGYTYSDDFPLVDAYDASHNGESDVFVFALPDMSDSDADGIPDYNESLYGTDRFLADSDHDNLTDSAEIFIHFTNPLSNDSDSDALDDYAEVAVYFTDPWYYDSDYDSMSDAWEVLYDLDPLNSVDALHDPDDDMLPNFGEFQNGTLPHVNDTDSDLMADGWEVLYNLNPLNPSDAEGDRDSDTLTNLQEFQLGTSPLLRDSDLDAIPDDWEVANGFDPLDPAVPLIEFLLYNQHITLILLFGGAGIFMVGFYIIRARIHERRSKRERDNEHEEIHSVIKDLEDDAVSIRTSDERDGLDTFDDDE